MRPTRGAEAEMWKTWDAPEPGADLWAWQAGRCAWCGYKDSLVEDHCHQTGLVRGLLCRACNQLEGNDWRGHFDGWRSGDNTANAIKHFEVYTNIYRATPVSPQSALHFYSYAEREAWNEQVVRDLAAGGAWPTEAPWTEAVAARRDDLMARAREAMNRWGA